MALTKLTPGGVPEQLILPGNIVVCNIIPGNLLAACALLCQLACWRRRAQQHSLRQNVQNTDD